MSRTQTEYRFRLPRRKRVGWVMCRVPLGLIGLSLFGGFMYLLLVGVWWAVLPGLVSLLLARGFLIATARFATRTHEDMCLAIAENGLGFGEHTPDWWLFADGFDSMALGSDGYWELHHVNGTFLSFPSGLISPDDISYLQSKIKANTDPIHQAARSESRS